jgi:squalene cyclase
MAHEQGAMTVSRGRRGSGSVILTSILTGGGLAGRGRMLELGWNGSRQPSPNRMLARSLAPLTIDPCLALDKAGAAQVQKIIAEDRNKRTVVWVQSPQTPQTSSGEADCEVERLGGFAACAAPLCYAR